MSGPVKLATEALSPREIRNSETCPVHQLAAERQGWIPEKCDSRSGCAVRERERIVLEAFEVIEKLADDLHSAVFLAPAETMVGSVSGAAYAIAATARSVLADLNSADGRR